MPKGKMEELKRLIDELNVAAANRQECIDRLWVLEYRCVQARNNLKKILDSIRL
jgi:hypothetical protein